MGIYVSPAPTPQAAMRAMRTGWQVRIKGLEKEVREVEDCP